ncbi:MAG: hypothetical protein HY286_07750 [Planctomycetes bacterium]|nr:hypothetical protein [Planctomycetota bacterium]
MKPSILQFAACALAMAAPSCVSGILYSDVTRPMTTNMRNSPIGTKFSDLDSKELHDPFITGVRVQWDSNAIGDVMKRNGIDRAHYADLRVRSILFGIWTQQFVKVAGEPASESKTDAK